MAAIFPTKYFLVANTPIFSRFRICLYISGLCFFCVCIIRFLSPESCVFGTSKGCDGDVKASLWRADSIAFTGQKGSNDGLGVCKIHVNRYFAPRFLLNIPNLKRRFI